MQKTINVDNQPVCYNIRVSKRAKYLQLRIAAGNRLEVVVPKRCSIKEGEKFLNNKIDWVKQHLPKLVQKNISRYLFGEKLYVIHSQNLFIKRTTAKLKDKSLVIESPPESSLTTNDIVDVYLKHYAKSYITKRVVELAERYNFKIGRISIRGQKTRWGSCSLKGNLSFNFKLMEYKKEVIDYVIIHELCHTKEMNHSVKFWKLVANIMPDYRIFKRVLKDGANI